MKNVRISLATMSTYLFIMWLRLFFGYGPVDSSFVLVLAVGFAVMAVYHE